MPSVEEIETAILRRLTPTQKLGVMNALWRQAWALKAAGVRARHPDWTDEQVTRHVREIFLRAAPDLISLFVTPLNTLHFRYFVTGAVAAVIYGEPRLTRDLDLVLDLPAAGPSAIAAAFASELFYVPPAEVLAQEAARPAGGHFKFIHHETGLRADCYVAGSDSLSAWALARIVAHNVAGVSVPVAPIEYVILRKLEWVEATV